METPTVSAISLIPADFASADGSRGCEDPALERMDLRVGPPGSLRLSFEDFTEDIDLPLCVVFPTVVCRSSIVPNRTKFARPDTLTT
jgi:hypothetical protein